MLLVQFNKTFLPLLNPSKATHFLSCKHANKNWLYTLKNITSSLKTFFRDITEAQLLFMLFAYAFFIRFPFFFRDYVDRDESTFILMGQSWVEGHLPYTELWDLKPPITFLFFATIIYVFGKSFLAIRIVGTLLVAISAFFTYKIGNNLGGKNIAFVCSVLVVILYSLFGSIQGVMSEHICMTFFIPAIYFFLFKKNYRTFFLSGTLFGLAIMSKLNMAYPLLFLFLFQLFHGIKNEEIKRAILKLIAVGLGVLTVVFITALPYILSGQFSVWWNSVALAPLAYTDSSRHYIQKVLPPIVMIVCLLYFSHYKKWIDFKVKEHQLLLGVILGVLFSFLHAKKINGHYLLQLYPFLLLLLVSILSKFSFASKLRLSPWLLLFLFLIPVESYLEINTVIKSKRETGTYFNGEGIVVPQYLKDNNIDYSNVLFIGYHIGYWVLDEKPPTKIATHPSNLMREELFPYIQDYRTTSKEELTFVMDEIKPTVVVTRKNRTPFDKDHEWGNSFMEKQLKTNYKVLDTVQKAVVYQRLPSL